MLIQLQKYFFYIPLSIKSLNHLSTELIKYLKQVNPIPIKYVFIPFIHWAAPTLCQFWTWANTEVCWSELNSAQLPHFHMIFCHRIVRSVCASISKGRLNIAINQGKGKSQTSYCLPEWIPTRIHYGLLLGFIFFGFDLFSLSWNTCFFCCTLFICKLWRKIPLWRYLASRAPKSENEIDGSVFAGDSKFAQNEPLFKSASGLGVGSW